MNGEEKDGKELVHNIRRRKDGGNWYLTKASRGKRSTQSWQSRFYCKLVNNKT
jgi:hypothetical protein